MARFALLQKRESTTFELQEKENGEVWTSHAKVISANAHQGKRL